MEKLSQLDSIQAVEQGHSPSQLQIFALFHEQHLLATD
jgi:hypothetical protein